MRMEQASWTHLGEVKECFALKVQLCNDTPHREHILYDRQELR